MLFRSLAESLRAFEGRDVIIGVRPEHLGVPGVTDIPQGVNHLRGKVIVVEPLGAQTDLIVNIGDEPIVVKVEGQAMVNVGDDIDLLVDQTRLHAFDPATEAAVDRGTPSGTRGQADTTGLGYEYPGRAAPQAVMVTGASSAD